MEGSVSETWTRKAEHVPPPLLLLLIYLCCAVGPRRGPCKGTFDLMQKVGHLKFPFPFYILLLYFFFVFTVNGFDGADAGCDWSEG